MYYILVKRLEISYKVKVESSIV